jgi:proton-dependent oligopeptide transporter, POT family
MGIVIVTVAVGFFLNSYLAGDLTAPDDRAGDSVRRRRAVLVGLEQAGSSLSIFASDLTQRQLGSFLVPASWFQNLNPAFIIILTPAFAAFWLYAEHRWEIPVLVRFGFALSSWGSATCCWCRRPKSR